LVGEPSGPDFGLPGAAVTVQVSGSHPVGPTRPLLPEGAVLNGLFEVRRLLGRGLIGEVYEGASTTTLERVAIKVFHKRFAEQAEVQQAFLRDMRALTRLAHPAVNAYRLAAREPTYGLLYLVYEFVDGMPLSALVGQVTMPEAKLLGLTRRLAEGLRHAHEMGVLHRQLSPESIIVASGRLDAGTIVDFSLSEAFDRAVWELRVGQQLRPPYAAPEQTDDTGAEVGSWTDVYGLGRVMFALATGEVPRDGRQAEPDLSHAPRRLRPLFVGMLASDPKLRFQNMDAVLAAVEDASRRRGPSGA